MISNPVIQSTKRQTQSDSDVKTDAISPIALKGCFTSPRLLSPHFYRARGMMGVSDPLADTNRQFSLLRCSRSPREPQNAVALVGLTSRVVAFGIVGRSGYRTLNGCERLHDLDSGNICAPSETMKSIVARCSGDTSSRYRC